MKFRRLIRSLRLRKQVIGYFDAERFARLEVVDNSNLVGSIPTMRCVREHLHPWSDVSSVPRRHMQCSNWSDLFGHVLSNFRQQLVGAVRF